MTVPALLSFAIYVVFLVVVGVVLIWVSDKFAPGELRPILRGAIVAIIVLLVLLRAWVFAGGMS
jgi:hypothetical protein